MKSGSLCAPLWRILSWCTRQQVTLRARHIPGRLNVIADKLSRLGQTIQTEWSLHPAVFQAVCSRWHHPQVDLFATRFNNKLPQFVSPVPDPQAWAVDALSLSWEDLDPYAFPPAAILGKVVEKLQQCDNEDIEHPICYFSKKFNVHQKNYLALILAIRHFDIYISSSSKPTVVYTDHNPLVFLHKMRNKNSRLLNWSLMLQEHNLRIEHVKGKDNICADALSRSCI